MTRRLSVLTAIMASCRIPAFNALEARGDVQLRTIFLSENDPSLRRWNVYKEVIKFLYEALPFWGAPHRPVQCAAERPGWNFDRRLAPHALPDGAEGIKTADKFESSLSALYCTFRSTRPDSRRWFHYPITEGRFVFAGPTRFLMGASLSQVS